MKRVVSLTMVLLSVLIIFCTKVFNSESEASTAVINSNIVVEFNKQGIPELTGILSDANQKSYAKGKKANFMAGGHLKEGNSDCVSCHGDSGKLDNSETQVNNACISCHGDLNDMAEITDKTELNPHKSHLGKISCTSCHGGHEPSMVYCNNCHTFDLSISYQGNKPMYKSIDIKKYDNAKSKLTTNVDVLIIGAGGSGLISAIAAKQKGAGKVMVIEKMPIPGGNSQLAAGGMNAAGTKYQKAKGIKDDVKTMYQDTMKGGKNMSNPALAQILAKDSNGSMNWLNKIGAELPFISMGGGASNKRFHAPEGGIPVGAYLVNIYKGVAEREGISVELNSPAVKILTKNGAVYGALVEGIHTGLYEIHAKSVILTSGGFSANQDLVVKYKPSYKGMTTSNQPGARGEGLDLAREANADIIDLTQIQIHPSVAVGSSTLITEAVRGVGAILINHDGKRFFDELSTRDKVSAAILSQPKQTAYLLLDDNIRKNLKQIEGYFHLNLAVEASTLGELAKKIKVPVSNLEATVKEYNKYVAQKNDKAFGKKSLPWKIEKGNFVAIEVSPGVHYTMGGVKINGLTQVIDTKGKPIRNFYAAGEVTGGVHGGNRLGGNSISETVTFGRIAGAEAATNSKK